MASTTTFPALDQHRGQLGEQTELHGFGSTEAQTAEHETSEAVFGHLVRLVVEVLVAGARPEAGRAKEGVHFRSETLEVLGVCHEVERDVAPPTEHAGVVVEGPALRVTDQ